MSKEEGIFYIATEEKFVTEAVDSVKSVKEQTDYSVAILTNSALADMSGIEYFDEVITIECTFDDLRDKIYNMDKTPFDRTLYLDGDTLVVGDITPVFELLQKVDISAAHATGRERIKMNHVPDAFPELSTAVLAFNSTESTLKLFNKWEQIHSELHKQKEKNKEEMGRFGTAHGQPPFREALYSSNVDYSILPSEYNIQPGGRGYVYENPKILHGGRRHDIARHLPLANKRIVFTTGDETKNIVTNRERLLTPIATNKLLQWTIYKLGIHNELSNIYRRLIRNN